MATTLFTSVITIPSGVKEWPPSGNGVATPGNVHAFSIELTTDNWPASPVIVEIQGSFDNGASWVSQGMSQYTNNWVATPQKPNPPVFSVGAGWGADQPKPQFVKAITTSSSSFSSAATIVSL